MAVDLLHQPTPTASADQSATTLVAGLVKDAQELFHQQVTLLKLEAREELRQTTQAAVALGIGLAITLIGAILLAFAAVYALNYLLPQYHIAIWYTVVGLVIAVAGGVLVGIAIEQFSKIHALPETQEAIKETLEWQTKPK